MDAYVDIENDGEDSPIESTEDICIYDQGEDDSLDHGRESDED